MSTKDITDMQVLRAYIDAAAQRDSQRGHFVAHLVWPEDLLMERTGQPIKVCFSAMDRACRHGLIEYGTSLHGGYLTDKGRALIAHAADHDAVSAT